MAFYGKRVNVEAKKNTIVDVDDKVYGMAFPIGRRTEKGFFNKESGIALVKNNLRQLLSTNKGERVMLPDFGTNLFYYLFEPLDKTTFTLIRDDILYALAKYAPGVELKKLTVLPNDNVSYEGAQGITITLVVELKELNNQLIDLTVEVG